MSEDPTRTDDATGTEGATRTEDPTQSGHLDESVGLVDRLESDRFGGLLSGVRFGKFASVGVVGAVADSAVLATLKLALSVPKLWAKAAGIETAIVVMFLVNEHWTFADSGAVGRGPFLKRFGKSHLVRTGGVTVQLVTYWFLNQRLTVELWLFGTDLWFLAASPIAIAAAMSVNYVFESLFTWRIYEDG